VHAPDSLAGFGIGDYAPKVRRAVADAGRWATISVCATLLATLASPSHAQVTTSYYPNGVPSFWIPQFGPRPYELFGSERAKLVAAAARAASPKVPLYNLNAYYGCKVGSDRCIEVGRAEILFGPYDKGNATFSMDSVSCIGNPRKWFTSSKWSCDPGETWTYVRAGELNTLVSFSSGISLETVTLIAAHKDAYCSLSKWYKRTASSQEELITAPHVRFDKETGDYELRTEYCGSSFKVKDGKVEETKSYGVLR
jgi:hypothetical protein